LARTRILSADTGSYTVSGQNAGISYVRNIQAASGSYSFTGESATINRDRVVSALPGAYSVDGQDAAIIIGGQPTPSVAIYFLKLRSFTERRRF
jgi:hypothetical protein